MAYELNAKYSVVKKIGKNLRTHMAMAKMDNRRVEGVNSGKTARERSIAKRQQLRFILQTTMRYSMMKTSFLTRYFIISYHWQLYIINIR